MAYNWRQMSPEQRAEVLMKRQQTGQPWHGPPHGLERHWYHLSATCYDHQPVLGTTPERMSAFEDELLATLAHDCEKVSVWCILPTHYHILVQCRSLSLCRKALGKLHGSASHCWNVEDDQPGRKCWHRCMPREVKSEAHRWATVNYIHHNPVHHGYAQRWQEWPFSSAEQYLNELGRTEAARIWRTYPVMDMGTDWDPEEL